MKLKEMNLSDLNFAKKNLTELLNKLSAIYPSDEIEKDKLILREKIQKIELKIGEIILKIE
jgi:hypothetical protein